MRIGRQPAREMVGEMSRNRSRRPITIAAMPARPSLPGDLDAIGRGVEHALALADRVIDFAGRDILALPAEGVADPVDEMKEALLVEPHQIAGAEPGVALGEDVAQDFLFGLGASV